MPDHVDPTPIAAPPAAARGALEADIIVQMQRLSTESQRVAQAFATRHGLGQIDLEALLHVMQAELRGDPLTAGGLGDALGVTSGAATGVIDRLVKVGHVTRDRDEHDRRRVLVRRADKARVVAGEFFGPLGALADRVMDDFDRAELETVQRFLGAMAPALARHAESVAGRRAETDTPRA
ncbi:MarR family winged helix-turn-helix transcriptional regulator [Frigoribacterium sp. 2-23]|uniref:MarR family winged helix-turn-helix transcriptional regulator n=1 Tax=Frigoribacterium sp. 2-23 TaxID=3415006 RepID=UPI003C703924